MFTELVFHELDAIYAAIWLDYSTRFLVDKLFSFWLNDIIMQINLFVLIFIQLRH